MDGTPKISLSGTVAFVSGASKGIGIAVAKTLAGAGADLALTARDEAGLEATAEAARASGVQVWTHTAELADAEAVKRLGEAVLSDCGRVDILVNNAGLTRPEPLFEVTLEAWHMTMNVDLLAPLLLTQAFGPGMVERGHGKIVNISSRAGLRALPGNAAYCAAKGGLHMLTQTMAVELGPSGIQANCIAPTVIMTPMAEAIWTPGPRTDTKRSKIPMGRFGEAEEVADMVLFLASPLSDFVNGTIIPIDGGEGAG